MRKVAWNLISANGLQTPEKSSALDISKQQNIVTHNIPNQPNLQKNKKNYSSPLKFQELVPKPHTNKLCFSSTPRSQAFGITKA